MTRERVLKEFLLSENEVGVYYVARFATIDGMKEESGQLHHAFLEDERLIRDIHIFLQRKSERKERA